jgi:hypothetical protein
MSIGFWFKLSEKSQASTYTLIDCKDTGLAELFKDTVTFSIWANVNGRKVDVSSDYFKDRRK